MTKVRKFRAGFYVARIAGSSIRIQRSVQGGGWLMSRKHGQTAIRYDTKTQALAEAPTFARQLEIGDAQ